MVEQMKTECSKFKRLHDIWVQVFLKAGQSVRTGAKPELLRKTGRRNKGGLWKDFSNLQFFMLDLPQGWCIDYIRRWNWTKCIHKEEWTRAKITIKEWAKCFVETLRLPAFQQGGVILNEDDPEWVSKQVSSSISISEYQRMYALPCETRRGRPRW